MPWPLGTAELQARLKLALGIRGAIPLELDESIIPVVPLLEPRDLEVFSTDPRPGMFATSSPASVGNFSLIQVAAGPGTLLVIEQIIFIALIGAETRRQVRLVTGASGTGFDIPAIRGTWNTSATPFFLAARGATSQPAALQGTFTIVETTLATGKAQIVYPGIILDGDGGGGGFAQGISIGSTSTNEEVRACVRVREYLKR